MDSIKKILIVCTGNSCRSPMAEGFLKEHLKPEDSFQITSAGISAMEGFKATREAIEVMKEEGIDISPYGSTPISKDLIEKADLILAMSGIHKQFILNMVPEAKNKVYLYKDFADINDGKPDIEDPIGQPVSVYRDVKEQIKRAAKEIISKIKGGLIE